ncbi:MAG: EamA family transporter [Ruminococcaceae bacterium]|nr:EamA family transporter [Oscillospiraceae bacterium]
MKNKKFVGGVVLVSISAASFGFLPIFAKMAYSAGTSSYTLLFLRFLVATVFMFSLVFFRKMPLPTKDRIWKLFLLGALVYFGQSFTYFSALNYASSGTVSLLLYLYPAIVMIGSAAIFNEKITVKKVLALCFALAGAFVIIGAEFKANFLGVFLALLSALLYSLYILISSAVVEEGKGIQSSAFIMLGSTVVYGIMNLFTGFKPPTEVHGYIAVGLIAIVSTVIAFGTFFVGMERTGPSIASLVSVLEPVVTVIASVIILSEEVKLSLIIGGILVMTSLFITLIPPKPDQKQSDYMGH